MPPSVRVYRVSPNTGVREEKDVSEQGLGPALASGWKTESDEAGAARAYHEGRLDTVRGTGEQLWTGLSEGLDALSFGAFNAARVGVGGDEARERIALGRENNPDLVAGARLAATAAPILASGGTGVLGTAARATPVGAVARLGSAIAKTGEEASLGARVVRGALGAGTEGTFYAAGETANDLAAADDPITLERIAGSLSSKFLTTGGVSALAGGVLGGVEHALSVSGRRLRATAAEESALDNAATIPDDIAAIPDRAGVKAAREAEIGRLKADRATQRAPFIADVSAFREQTKIDQPWLAVATGGTEAEKLAARKLARGTARSAAEAESVAAAAEAKLAEVTAQAKAADAASAALGVKPTLSPARAAAESAAQEARAAATTARELADDAAAKYEIASSNMKIPRWMSERGKTYIEADKHIDRLLRNTEGLAEATTAGESARRSLRAALQEQRQALTEIADRSSDLNLMHAMDSTTRRADALASIPKTIEANQALQARIDALSAPFESPRLAALDAHDLNLGTPKAPPSLMQKIKAGAAGAAVYGAANAVLPGFAHFAAAPLAAAAGARMLDDKIAPALVAAKRASTERSIKAVDSFMTATRTARKFAAPVASRVLADARFAPEPEQRTASPRKQPTLADSFEARSSELASLVTTGPDGKPMVQPHVRQQIADHLRPIAMAAAHIADRIETAAVKRLLFLDSKRPRTKQIGMTSIPPSEMEIRAWARYVAAADDPGGVEERLADGTVTREDRETMQALYPERLAEITRMVVEKMATLRATLPHQKRLALSIFTGAPVDASMEPRILAQLQGVYATEPGTEGGKQAPMPRPAFGSVKKPEATPAQQRAG